MFEASKVLFSSLENRPHPLTEQHNYRRAGALKGAMLLLGLAVESALKGALVFGSTPDLSNGKLDRKHFQDEGFSHNLNMIAAKLRNPIDNELMELLERLTVFVQWASKYQSALRKTDHNQGQNKILLHYPNDYKNVNRLINELQKRSGFDEENGWPIPI
jgi:hypothetical protein